ncbi:MAG: iron ABC transporter permease [Treponema sp.]|nr:iron ABC transporter permease [Treponema sp.]
MINSEHRRSVGIIVLLFVCCLCAFCVSLVMGAEDIPLATLLGGEESDPFYSLIFFDIRLPRSLLALLAGMLLGGAGAVFQLYFRNPLAEPGIMGISAGATFGAVVAHCLGTFSLYIPLLQFGAFTGALCAGLLITVLSLYRKGPGATVMVLLCGTALGTVYSALTSILLTVNQSELQSMYMWMLGSFSGRGWMEFRFILIPALGALACMLMSGRKLDMLYGGEVVASSLGVPVGRLRFAVLLSGCFATSSAVCAGGTIGFVGLVAPHIVRRLIGVKGTVLIPVSMLLGATLLLCADTVSRCAIRPSELPVGIIMSLVGAPFFISLIFHDRNIRNG